MKRSNPRLLSGHFRRTFPASTGKETTGTHRNVFQKTESRTISMSALHTVTISAIESVAIPIIRSACRGAKLYSNSFRTMLSYLFCY